jgi:hypothetical protein
MSEGVRKQVTHTPREMEFAPKGRVEAYQKPNPEHYDLVPYRRGFKVPDFVKFTGDDVRTTYEHVRQFLAQVSDPGITDVHKVKLFPLSMSSTAFNWFISLAPNSVATWADVEGKFHEYFYNGETELKLSDLTMVRQKYTKIVAKYVKRFREMRNRCYSLTVRGKDLADLVVVGMPSYLREKLERQEFMDVNQVLQCAVAHKNCARDGRSQGQFRETTKEIERNNVNMVDDDISSEEEEVCVGEWVDAPQAKPLKCSFLKPEPSKNGEMKFTFDVSKCDRLFDVLLQNNIIKLKGGYVIPTAEQLARKKYCKWHDSFSHITNECNYFCRQIQLALNDGHFLMEK